MSPAKSCPSSKNENSHSEHPAFHLLLHQIRRATAAQNILAQKILPLTKGILFQKNSMRQLYHMRFAAAIWQHATKRMNLYHVPLGVVYG